VPGDTDRLGGTTRTHAYDDSFIWREGRVRGQHQGKEPAVVLGHDTPWSSRVGDGVATSFTREWTVYRWDMVGSSPRASVERARTRCGLVA
jgi:hypothetical protein